MKKAVGSTYERAVSYLNDAAALPRMVLVTTDDVLWPGSSRPCRPEELSPHTQAQGVLAALRQRGVKAVALVDEASQAAIKAVLARLELDGLFEAQQVCKLTPPEEALVPSSSSSSAPAALADGLRACKSLVGVPLSESIMFHSDLAAHHAAAANRAGCCPAPVPAAGGGLTVEALRDALERYAERIGDSRGY